MRFATSNFEIHIENLHWAFSHWAFDGWNLPLMGELSMAVPNPVAKGLEVGPQPIDDRYEQLMATPQHTRQLIY